MRNLLLVSFGVLLCLVVLFFVFPLYSDYRAESQTGSWLMEMSGVKQEIERVAIRERTLNGVGKNINVDNFYIKGITYFDVLDSGVILVQGGSDGQVLVLVPSILGEKVYWRCVGGSARSVVATCRGQAR